MADIQRRYSKANWSTKNRTAASAPYCRLPSEAAVFEDVAEGDEEDDEDQFKDALQDASSMRTQSPHRLARIATAKPQHRVDNSGYNRRFSVHVAKGQAPTMGGVPALPMNAADMVNGSSASMNKQQSRQRQQRTAQGEVEEPLAVQMASPDFDATQYMRKNLRNADAETIDKFTQELTQLSLQNKHDVKTAIGQSLDSVLAVSQSIAQTQEMLQKLKQSVSSLNEVLVQQSEDAASTAPADKRRSVMFLEKKWASDLSKLFREVDGAQQFVSATPGRHVVAESKRWGELNPLTQKPIRPAHLIVLNDRLMLATRKRIDDKKRTIATGCWPIRDVVMDDAGTTNGKDFTLAFRTGNNVSFLFQTDSQGEYNKIVQAFKKAKSDVVRLSESDEFRTTGALRKSKSRARLSSDRIHDLNSQLTHRRARSRDAHERSDAEHLLNIDESLTNVDIYLGHHQFTECVGFINRLREQLEEMAVGAKNDSQIRFLIQVKEARLDELTDSVVSGIAWEVANPRTSPDRIAELMELFRILKIEDKGRTIMLDAKTKQMEEMVTNIKYEGDLRSYLLQVSIVYFNFIKQAYLIYAQCFPQTKDKTFIIEWANERVSNYNKFFHRQLIDYNRDSSVYQSCAEIARQQSEPLKKLGMNVDYLFDF